jgi:hypothetical protein
LEEFLIIKGERVLVELITAWVKVIASLRLTMSWDPWTAVLMLLPPMIEKPVWAVVTVVLLVSPAITSLLIPEVPLVVVVPEVDVEVLFMPVDLPLVKTSSSFTNFPVALTVKVDFLKLASAWELSLVIATD